MILDSQIPFHRVVVDTGTSDLYKSAWEDVPGKSAQELNTTESDVLFSRSLSVIPGNEGHFFIRDIHYTLVSDGDSMGILIDSFPSTIQGVSGSRDETMDMRMK